MKPRRLLPIFVLLLISGAARADSIAFTQLTRLPAPLRSHSGASLTARAVLLEHEFGKRTARRGFSHFCRTDKCDPIVGEGGFLLGDRDPEHFTPEGHDEGSDVVPEPSTLVLACTGLLGIAGRAIRQLRTPATFPS